MIPVFSSVHTQWPTFFHFIKFYIQIVNFLAPLHVFLDIYQFCCNFNIKFANFGMKLLLLLLFVHTNDPYLGEST